MSSCCFAFFSKPKPVVTPKVVDLKPFLDNAESPDAQRTCNDVATSLKETGIVILKDPRVSESDSSVFLDMMEDYFAQPLELKMADVRKEVHYQVGATPSLMEIPACKADEECLSQIDKLPKQHRPNKIVGPDPKWRFFWRIGERSSKPTGFEDLNAAPVVPTAFPQWTKTMDSWGSKMLNAVTTCAEMAALGFGLERDAISRLMKMAPHLLAPTGSDLSGNWCKPGTVLAGWHSDLNLLTIHGKSRYPGLNAWLADGTKIQVKVPEGCLLVQAGMQIERLTGGAVQAGMHEVVVLPSTVEAAERQAAKGRPAWRISSTLFAHIASNQELRPLGPFATEKALERFPPILAGEQVMSVLKKINLASPPSEGEQQEMGA
mmetsp:Transcript_36264/g.63883  ORF Transcript_36264/g.63883 Transcript_36264/m.63883 type:complete len:377 (+) Transcript_36264:87-1217(+)